MLHATSTSLASASKKNQAPLKNDESSDVNKRPYPKRNIKRLNHRQEGIPESDHK